MIEYESVDRPNSYDVIFIIIDNGKIKYLKSIIINPESI